MVVNGMTAAERQAVIDIFGPAPTHDAALNGPPVRECLAVGAVRRQLAKSVKDQEKRKRALLEGASGVFERGGRKMPEVDEEQVKDLHAKIGELAVANDFLARKLKPWTGK